MFLFPSSLQAALKQLAKNKVPNMAVLLKSIIHTHADAKAVFKDPTGSGCTRTLSCLEAGKNTPGSTETTKARV